MPVFPANKADGSASYIPANCYFMMGDNRFNSLDMRHSYDEKLVPLTKMDRYSVTYYSNIAPQVVNKKYILGTTSDIAHSGRALVHQILATFKSWYAQTLVCIARPCL